MPLRVVCISDTHGLHDQVDIPGGDILIHAGDLTHHGALQDVQSFNDFLGRLPHPHKVVIAGNHDFAFERQPQAARSLLTAGTYLQDSEAAVAGLRIYGSPWQPWFCDWAFNLQRGPEIRAMWERIPAGIDILVTHGPPAGHGDRTAGGRHAGCADLLEAIRRVGPRWHIFGHIHEGYGVTREGPTTCVNASLCDVDYRLANAPVVVEI